MRRGMPVRTGMRRTSSESSLMPTQARRAAAEDEAGGDHVVEPGALDVDVDHLEDLLDARLEDLGDAAARHFLGALAAEGLDLDDLFGVDLAGQAEP